MVGPLVRGQILLRATPKLRAARAEKLLTQRAFAGSADIDVSYYCQIELGKQRCSVVTAAEIAKALGVTLRTAVDRGWFELEGTE